MLLLPFELHPVTTKNPKEQLNSMVRSDRILITDFSFCSRFIADASRSTAPDRAQTCNREIKNQVRSYIIAPRTAIYHSRPRIGRSRRRLLRGNWCAPA